MKKNKIFSFSLILASVLFCENLSAQELEADFSEGEKIELPEVTTTVTGDSLVAGKDAVPDFSNLVPPALDQNVPLPVLPQVSQDDSQDELEAQLDFSDNKNVFAEGIIGGGFPGYFTGDFSVYKNSGDNPFLLEFSHESQNGYGSKKAVDGYVNSDTALHGQKTFSFNVFSCTIEGAYENTRYGLQSKSTDFYDLNFQNISTNDVFQWSFSNGFNLGTNVNAAWYTRYAGLKNSAFDGFDQEKNIVAASLSPDLFAMWKNNFLCFRFDAQYNGQAILSNFHFDTEYTGPKTTSVNRGSFKLYGLWHNENISVSADVAAVLGTQIGFIPVIVPFNVDFSGRWKLGSALRTFSLELKGGLDSKQELLSDLELQNLFVTNIYLPSETSDWYFTANTSIPVGSFITIDLAAEFRQTAFGNGIWEGNYNSFYSDTAKLYYLQETDRTLLTFDATVSYLWNIFTVGANYKANFLYVPVNESPNKIGLFVDYTSEDSRWGFNTEVAECIGPNADFIPYVNGSIFYKFRDSIRLAIVLEDAIKLFSGTNRTFSVSDYELKSGYCALEVRFFF